MMLNLFNIFDPSINQYWNLNWISLFLPMIFLTPKFWLIPSRFIMFLNTIFTFLKNEFQNLTQKIIWINNLFLISLFYMILMMNFMGLIPYIFTPSSHLVICLSLSLPLWFTMFFYKFIFYNKHSFAHLTPMNTPYILLPFMVIIESISNIIRPFTLAIRLTANLISGHLLLCLIGNIMSFNIFPIIFFAQTLLMILEMSVSLIQAIVFSMLSTLYINE